MRYARAMRITARARLVLRVTVMLLVFSLFVVALIGLGVASYGLSKTASLIVPNRGLFVGLLLSALALLLMTTLLLVGTLRSPTPLFTAAAALCACALCGFFVVGSLALAQSDFLAEAEFEEQWHRASAASRLTLEHTFACCGFASVSDYYGQNWNVSCSSKALEKLDCCVGMRLWNATLQEEEAPDAECAPGQPRYACCVLLQGQAAWPCYRLPACRGLVTTWLQSFVTHAGTLALVLASYSSAALVLIVVGVWFVARRSGVGAPEHFWDDEVETGDEEDF